MNETSTESKPLTDEERKQKEERLKTKIENLLHDRNFKKWGLDLNPVVSIGAGVFILIFCVLSLIDLEKTQQVLINVQDSILKNANWLILLSSNMFLLICVFLAVSKFGNVRLGGVDAKPRFSNFSWYSMLISAGMGIGLMFYSVGEPLIHSNILPPIFKNADTLPKAMATTFFHWGIHPWAIYALVALALAFYAFNRKLPLSLRSVFYPIFKEKVFGVLGDAIDLLSVIACLFGLAASLGVGVQQINSGLNYVAGIPYNTVIQVILIVIITFIATLSVVTGIDKGVKFLSRMNIKIAFVFMLLIFLLGPTGYILETLVNSVGVYFNQFIESSFYLSSEHSAWQGQWSIFYLAWWISWSPFVGMFIARISKGRTVREFIIAVVIIPSLMTFAWMSVFGATAFKFNEQSGGNLFSVVQDNLPVALFEMIKYINTPIFTTIVQLILSIIAILLVISFFVTSSDSGSLVVDNITSGGKLDSPMPQRVFWACMEGVVAAVLLVIGGPKILNILQTALITTGLPFAILLSVMAIVLVLEIEKAYKRQRNIKSYRVYQDMTAKMFDCDIEDLENLTIKIEQQEQNKKKKKVKKLQ